MTLAPPRPDSPATERPGEQARVAPVELFFDLVFVFALTQVTAYLADDLTWARTGEGMLLLALLWWAWSAYTWVANVSDRDATEIRALLFVSMIALFFCALTLEEALGSQATTFAVAYVVVRAVHALLYWLASRRGQARWSGIAGFELGAAVSGVLLITGSLAGGDWQIGLWTAALLIDLAGPYVTRESVRDLQDVGVGHFAERFGLFIILCLGESIVAVGIGVGDADLSALTGVGVTLALLATVALWWTYFDYVAGAAEHRLARMDDPVSAARDGYSYVHVLMVAGIVIFAVGAKKLVADPGEALGEPARLAFCGGVVLYLVGHVLFRLRMERSVSREKVAGALACSVAFVALAGVDAWLVALAVVAVLAVMCAREAVVERALRARLRGNA